MGRGDTQNVKNAQIFTVFMQKRWGNEYTVANNEQYSVKFMQLRKGKQHHLKYHNEKTETLFIVKGSGFIIHDGTFHTIKEGDTVTILPKDIHKLWCSKEEDLYMLEINCPPTEESVCLEI